MQKNTVYIRPKVVGPFSEPYASGSYVHRAALFYTSWDVLVLLLNDIVLLCITTAVCIEINWHK
jgi:hypothetical protein